MLSFLYFVSDWAPFPFNVQGRAVIPLRTIAYVSHGCPAPYGNGGQGLAVLCRALPCHAVPCLALPWCILPCCVYCLVVYCLVVPRRLRCHGFVFIFALWLALSLSCGCRVLSCGCRVLSYGCRVFRSSMSVVSSGCLALQLFLS